jgi:hypothetical protein
MKAMWMPLLILFALALLIFALPGCAYTSPWNRTELGEKLLGSKQLVLVSLTLAQRKAGQHGPFFDQVRSVLADLPTRDGLLGYAFRFELFGDKAWTVTAWRDEAARDQFVYQGAHRAAMRKTDEVLESCRFGSLDLMPSDLPPDWSKVTEILAKAPPTPLRHKPHKSSTP